MHLIPSLDIIENISPSLFDEIKMYEEIDVLYNKKEIINATIKLNKILIKLNKIKNENYTNLLQLKEIYDNYSLIKNKYTKFCENLYNKKIIYTENNFMTIPIINLKVDDINEIICKMALVFEKAGIITNLI